MTNQSIPTISHFVALLGIDPFDNSARFVESLAKEVINGLGLKVVGKISHVFSPNGITTAFILSQSHLIIHTWPEYGFIHLDLVVCKLINRKGFKKSLKHALKGENFHFLKIKSVKFDE